MLLLLYIITSSAFSGFDSKTDVKGDSFVDDFISFDSTLWTQDADLFHCDDICFQANPNLLDYSPRGLQVTMQTCPSNSCCVGSSCADYAAGHLASKAKYGYGRYEFTARIAHGAQGRLGPPRKGPRNKFTCFSVYISKPVHNEIAPCFDKITTQIHFAWWYDSKMHRHIDELGFDASQDFHTYRFDWYPDKVKFYVDDRFKRITKGTPYVDIPWEPAPIKVILRPKHEWLPNSQSNWAYMDVRRIVYTKLEDLGYAQDLVLLNKHPEGSESKATQGETEGEAPLQASYYIVAAVLGFSLGLCCVYTVFRIRSRQYRTMNEDYFEEPILLSAPPKNRYSDDGCGTLEAPIPYVSEH